MAVDADATDVKPSPPSTPSTDGSNIRTVALISVCMLLAVAACAGWLGYRAFQGHQAGQQNNEFVQVARQGALNLTTIDFAHAEADVQRILDGATGSFHDDFQSRSAPFVDVVKLAQSKSEGSIVDAALESAHDDEAQVLVAVNVNTSVAGNAEPQPRAWRMRVTVHKVDDGAKVSNVEFIP